MLYNLLSVDFGPFNPLMGCIFALGAVAYAIRRSFLGRKQIWQTEHNALPETVNKMGTVASIAGIVLIYVSATPDRMHDMMGWLIWFAILAILSYLLYYFLANVCSCTMVTGANGQDPVTRKILCGLWLTPEGRKAKREHANVKRKDLLFGSGGNIDLVWSNVSIETARLLLILLFIMVTASTTLALTTAGCVLQVKLTGKPASAVFTKSDVPGFQDDSTSSKRTSHPKTSSQKHR